KATTEHTLAAIARLRCPFLGEILASEAARIADRINLDELAEGRRAFQALCDFAIADERDVSVQPATALKRRHAIGPQTVFDLQPSDPLPDGCYGVSSRPLVCVQPPETSPGLAMQLHKPHGTA